MLSSSAREVWQKPNAVPGPGEYNVVPLEGGLLRPSHNVLLSDNYQCLTGCTILPYSYILICIVMALFFALSCDLLCNLYSRVRSILFMDFNGVNQKKLCQLHKSQISLLTEFECTCNTNVTIRTSQFLEMEIIKQIRIYIQQIPI